MLNKRSTPQNRSTAHAHLAQQATSCDCGTLVLCVSVAQSTRLTRRRLRPCRATLRAHGLQLLGELWVLVALASLDGAAGLAHHRMRASATGQGQERCSLLEAEDALRARAIEHAPPLGSHFPLARRVPLRVTRGQRRRSLEPVAEVNHGGGSLGSQCEGCATGVGCGLLGHDVVTPCAWCASALLGLQGLGLGVAPTGFVRRLGQLPRRARLGRAVGVCGGREGGGGGGGGGSGCCGGAKDGATRNHIFRSPCATHNFEDAVVCLGRCVPGRFSLLSCHRSFHTIRKGLRRGKPGSRRSC